MNPDDLKQAWQARTAQTRLVIDAEQLRTEVSRNRQRFTTTVFWRDVREVGVALLMVPLWIYLGVAHALPWTWYLTVPAVLWIAGFLLVDRLRHKQQLSELGEPLLECVTSSLSQVEHQTWLLRNVGWWYLLPLALPMLAFFGQVAWRTCSTVVGMLLGVAAPVAVVGIVFAGIYWLNQTAVRCALEPRRQELQALLASLKDPAPETNEASM